MSLPTSIDDYRPCLGEDFILHHDGRTYALKLESVESAIENHVQSCFSLFFLCATARLSQGNFRLSHNRLGEFDLFLVPIRQKRDGLIIYQAVFNLLKGELQ